MTMPETHESTSTAPPNRAEHEDVKARMRINADKIRDLELEQAEIKGRLNLAENNIQRLTQTSATSSELGSVKELMTLKLDHLLVNQFDMKAQIKKSTRWVFFCVLCGIVALLYSVWAR